MRNLTGAVRNQRYRDPGSRLRTTNSGWTLAIARVLWPDHFLAAAAPDCKASGISRYAHLLGLGGELATRRYRRGPDGSLVAFGRRSWAPRAGTSGTLAETSLQPGFNTATLVFLSPDDRVWEGPKLSRTVRCRLHVGSQGVCSMAASSLCAPLRVPNDVADQFRGWRVCRGWRCCWRGRGRGCWSLWRRWLSEWCPAVFARLG
jgi:hypothetical protein